MKSKFGILVALFVGMSLGASVGHVSPSNLASSASAATTAPMSMPSGGSISAMPIGDAQMMKAMTKMDAAMKSAHLNGEQDHDFMQMMIPHHQAAIGMAQVELRYGYQPQLKAMAPDIVKGQSTEIAQMRQWLCKWDADCSHIKR
jgi:uncharacterized protein (DUF305 family)